MFFRFFLGPKGYFSLLFLSTSNLKSRRQVAKVENCSLKRVGTLDFGFYYGSCTNTNDRVYLCFGDGGGEYQTCHLGTDPLGIFETIEKSSYSHATIRIASSECKRIITDTNIIDFS